VPWYRYERLLPGNQIPGPAMILRSDTTIFLGEGDQAIVDDYLNLMIHLNLS
jgi:N-methylhydantoinase A/oxoprolinase/acetone carboxylase beta subunit